MSQASVRSEQQRRGQRLLVFVPARRFWPGGARGALSPATVVPYLALHADGSMLPGTAPLAQLPKARAIDLVFNCLDVYTTTIAAPRLSDAKLRQALPNLLEERMLADPVDCHFAWIPARAPAPVPAPDAAGGAAAEAGWLSVAAIDRTTLARTLEAFTAAQLQPHAAYSEIYTIPGPKNGTFCVRIEHGRGVLRTGVDQGCTFALGDGASGALGLAKHQLGLSRLRVYGDGAGALTPIAVGLGIVLEDTYSWADQDAIEDSVNLLQGSFTSAGSDSAAGRLLARLQREGTWKAPAAWAAICAAIAIGGLNAYWLKLDAQYQGLRESMRHQFRDAFPSEPSIVDELAQARRSVAALRARTGRPSANDFSVLNAQALEVFAAAPVGIVAAIEYADTGYVLRCKPGSLDNADLRNSLQARAMAQGLGLRFEADGSARLTPLGG